MVTDMGHRRRDTGQGRQQEHQRKGLPFNFALHLSPFALLFILPTLLLWSVTFGGKTLVPADLLLVMSPWRHFARERFPEFERVKAPLLDVLQQYYPWRKFYADTLKQNELPLWNPFMFCGTPFVGNGMSAVFYPPNLLFVIMPVDVAFGWCAWLHLVLAGIFMFGFLRRFVSLLSALTGAFSFQLCGFFVAWLAYLPLLCTAVWLPSALWAYEFACKPKAVFSPSPLLPCSLAAISLGMSLLAGHPQIAFYVLWAFTSYVVLRSLFVFSPRHLVIGVLALVFGVAFGAVQLLPLLEFAKLSYRSGAETFTPASGLPLDQFVRLFVPNFFGNWADGTHWAPDPLFSFVERTGYPSVVGFLLAAVGMTALARKERRSALSGWLCIVGTFFALFGLLAASIPFVHRFMALGLPGTQAFVGISRALFLFNFGIAMLCAVGVERVMESRQKAEGSRQQIPEKTQHLPSSPQHLPLSVALGGALLVMVVCIAYSVAVHGVTAFHPLLHDYTMAQIYRWLIFTTAGVLVIWLLISLRFASETEPSDAVRNSIGRRDKKTLTPRRSDAPMLRRLLLGLLPMLIAADLLSFAFRQHPEAERDMVFFETPSIRWLKEHLGSQRFVAVGTDAIRHWTPSNTLMVYRLRDAKGSDSLMTMRFNRFAQAWDEGAFSQPFAVRNFASSLLDLMAVRYIVSAVELPPNERNDLRLAHVGDLWVYENPDALSRAFVASKLRWAKTPQEASQKVTVADFDPHRLVVLEGNGETQGDKVSVTHGHKTAIIRDGINSVLVGVDLPSQMALVLADSVYPGWLSFRKSADGKWQPLPIFIADYAFRAVLLPEGKHQVAWAFFPSTVVVGLFLSLCSWGMICFGVSVQLSAFISQQRQNQR